MKIRKALVTLVVALLGSAGLLAVTPSPATAGAGPLVGPYRIYNSYSGLCIQLTTPSWDPGVGLQTALCNQQSYQYFYLELTGNSGEVGILPAYNLMCLDTWPYMFSAGSPVRQQYCDIPIGSTQRWLVAIITDVLVKFQSTYYAGPGYCIRSNDLYTLSPIVQGYCNDHNAIWQLLPQ